MTLAWILVHLYSEPEFLQTAREEIERCPSFQAGSPSYSDVQQLEFLNSCIDEAVRLHTMLPGNTVLRKAKREVWYGGDAESGGTRIPSGAILWLYPNAVHLDESFFPKPTSFCPMRLLSGNREKMNSEYAANGWGTERVRCPAPLSVVHDCVRAVRDLIRAFRTALAGMSSSLSVMARNGASGKRWLAR